MQYKQFFEKTTAAIVSTTPFPEKTSKKQQQHQLHQKTGTLKLFIKSEKWRQHKTSALTEFATTSATT